MSIVVLYIFDWIPYHLRTSFESVNVVSLESLGIGGRGVDWEGEKGYGGEVGPRKR